MALYENKVTLKGYIGKDAESFATQHRTPSWFCRSPPSPATRTSRRTSG